MVVVSAVRRLFNSICCTPSFSPLLQTAVEWQQTKWVTVNTMSNISRGGDLVARRTWQGGWRWCLAVVGGAMVI